ncbi:hypothetical protein COCC4DRAFT_62969 [Bipolaris maydis ATCC 48331]|uniref:Uncharacterized protein n=2 Tax=Cochliobolus heterostrophus TaxID=5016 RepID=M2SN61_COCH5|nr:uncharacterized protein COCC4DRAFT_62969 [Bipolaris maydis ATCC 48331]EMD86770.1 hypothetical protein COCHEDRAFT_1034536 [Bipolaris maydis C5]ENI03163.1 hypothetical protein COCC4DRAFT_62969 [Bipolaris maydis ATCC 48331]
MNYSQEKDRCLLCEKHRSGNASKELGWSSQICKRPKCAESKRLLKRLLQKVSESDGNTSTLAFKVYHYHYFSQRGEAELDRTPAYHFELHAESLPKNDGLPPDYGTPAHVGERTKFHGDISLQHFARGT